MKSLAYPILGLLSMALFFNACKKDDIITPPETLDECNPFVASGESRVLTDRSVGVDYIINCVAKVQGDLIVEPGVTIAFGSEGALSIENSGSMNAEGTLTDSIIFTGVDKEPGSWGFIGFKSNDVKNKMNFCRVSYGGGFQVSSNGDKGNVVVLSQARLALDSCSITRSAQCGVRFTSKESIVASFEGNYIELCEPPLAVSVNNVKDIGYFEHERDWNRDYNVELDAIHVTTTGTSNPGSIEGEHIWIDNIPFLIKKDIKIQGHLILDGGSKLSFEAGTGITVGPDEGAALSIDTSFNFRTDFAGKNRTEYWDGIEFRNTSSPDNLLYNIAISNISSDVEGAIYMYNAPTLTVENCSFQDMKTCAFYAAPSSNSPNPNLTEGDNDETFAGPDYGGYLCGD